jgi:hypothetical protein
MDIIQQHLSLTPVPCLIPAFSAFKFIWSDVEQAQVDEAQLEVLAHPQKDTSWPLECTGVILSKFGSGAHNSAVIVYLLNYQ